MSTNEKDEILSFLKRSERLKNTIRTSYTSEGRQESVAEHTWRLCLMALVFEDYLTNLNTETLLKMCIIHDLGEAIGGDIPAPDQKESFEKSKTERKDLIRLLDGIPNGIKNKIINLWDDYENVVSPEAEIAKALDKLETIIQHNQGENPHDFDHAFDLNYGRKYTSRHPFISAFRQLVDNETKKLVNKSD